MATYTWYPFPIGEASVWSNGAYWELDFNPGAGVPGAGDTALAGGGLTLDVASLSNITLQMPELTSTVVVTAPNVDLGDNFVLQVVNPDEGFDLDVYEVIGTGTLDDSHQTIGLTPKVGAIDTTVAALTIELADGATFFDEGSIFGIGIQVLTAGSSDTGTFINNSTIDASGIFVIGAGVSLSGAGVVDFDGAGGGDIEGSVAAGQTLEFTNQPHNNTQYGGVNIANLAIFQGTVVLSQDNDITLPNLDSAEQSWNGDLLTFANGETLHVRVDELANNIFVLPGSGGTTVFAVETACFAAGTRIATPAGEVPVENLATGDYVRLARGGTATVRWVGHRHVRCDRHPRPHDVLPIRVRAGTFAKDRPARDLYLSPDHAVFVDGRMIPIRYLLNGATIVQQPTHEVTYWHVELDHHDILLAEGMPAESYLDTGNRAAFADVGPIDLHPDFAVASLDIWARDACAPLVLGGDALATVHGRLLHRANRLGARSTTDPEFRVLADDTAATATAVGGIWTAHLPFGTRGARLRSRVWVPAHMGPANTDTRALGVAIGRLWIDGREAALDSSILGAGWHAPEPGLRWTDGDGRIDVPGARVLAMTLAITGTYWCANMPPTSARSAAA